MASPSWLRNLSRGFKSHRLGRPGWFLEIHRDRLRVVSAELPPRPGETSNGKRRAITLATPPGPSTASAALAEACAIFDACLAGTWRWPDPSAPPSADDPARIHPAFLGRLIEQLHNRLVGELHNRLVGERMLARTWHRNWAPYLDHLLAVAGEKTWAEEELLLTATLRRWAPNSRSRQMAHDRLRSLWRLAGWAWPDSIAAMRGNGKAAADPRGVRAFTDEEIEQLRDRILTSKLSSGVAVAWDCLIVFGLRPIELVGLEVHEEDGLPIARVTRSKLRSAHREVPAVPPRGWPKDCHQLVVRFQEYGIARHLAEMASGSERKNVGDRMAHQLKRLGGLDPELTPYGLRHAFALRLGIDLGLSVREAAQLMGHSPQVHLNTYGRRLERPALMARVRRLVSEGIPNH